MAESAVSDVDEPFLYSRQIAEKVAQPQLWSDFGARRVETTPKAQDPGRL